MIKVYHGTNFSSAFDIWRNGIDLNKSLPYLDFGQGFYVTDNKNKAVERAFKKTNDFNRHSNYNEKPCLVEMYINESCLDKMKTKFFKPRQIEWFNFVINNRMELEFLESRNITNHNKDNKYDIVYGEIADGEIAKIANRIKRNIIDIENIDYSSILPDTKEFYGSQYSFHTRKSLSCINGISCVIINSD